MPRRKKPQATKRDWRWYALTALNVFVALSMVLGTVLLFSGGSLTQQRVALPTVIDSSTGAFPVNTLAPTIGAPTSAAVPPSALPSPTPELSPTAKP